MSTFKGACGTEQGCQGLASLGLQNLSFSVGGDSEGRRRSQVSGVNTVIKVLLRSVFNFSYIVDTIEDWNFLDCFCGVQLGIYIFFAPTLKDTVENYPPGAQSKHYPNTVTWKRSTCKAKEGDGSHPSW